MPVGVRTITVSVTNPADRPRRVIGITEGCRPGGCCWKAVRAGQVSVAPGQTVPYELELTVGQPGPFETNVELYLEDKGIKAVSLTFRGTAVAPEKES